MLFIFTALTHVVTQLVNRHQQFKHIISFADYVMLAAVCAAEKGFINAGNSSTKSQNLKRLLSLDG